MTGREALGAREIRSQLVELNAHVDGPCGVAVVCVRLPNGHVAGVARVAVADSVGAEPVVHIPGDGKSFPVRAFAEALAAAQVQVEP